MLIDSHCHLHFLDFSKTNDTVETVIERAKANGVDHFLCVATELSEYEILVQYAEQYPDVSISIGVHPTNEPGHIFTEDDLMPLIDHPKLIAIGETGLDYFRLEGDLSWQRERFRMQMNVAKQCKKPLIIHTRAAKEDTIQLMHQEEARDIGGVIHCFTEDWDMAKKCLDMDFLISFSGIVTFKNAKALQEVAMKVPLTHMLIETDSPYLAPVPYRGKQNEPSYVRHVADFIAELRGTSVEEIATATSNNFNRVFRNNL